MVTKRWPKQKKVTYPLLRPPPFAARWTVFRPFPSMATWSCSAGGVDIGGCFAPKQTRPVGERRLETSWWSMGPWQKLHGSSAGESCVGTCQQRAVALHSRFVWHLSAPTRGEQLRSEKLQNESSPNFSSFCPELCPEFFEEFSCFVLWETETRKIHQKSPPVFNGKSLGKFEEIIHKSFLESGQSNNNNNNKNNNSQRAPDVHQQTCPSQWAENCCKEWWSLALPAMHLLCMCLMLVPSEFSFARLYAKNLQFWNFPGIPCISESAKKLQKPFGRALSHLIIRRCLILVRVIAQEAPKTLKWPSGCAHLVHSRRRPKLKHTSDATSVFALVLSLFCLSLWRSYFRCGI